MGHPPQTTPILSTELTHITKELRRQGTSRNGYWSAAENPRDIERIEKVKAILGSNSYDVLGPVVDEWQHRAVKIGYKLEGAPSSGGIERGPELSNPIDDKSRFKAFVESLLQGLDAKRSRNCRRIFFEECGMIGPPPEEPRVGDMIC
jgi:hypothetical protein